MSSHPLRLGNNLETTNYSFLGFPSKYVQAAIDNGCLTSQKQNHRQLENALQS